MCLSDTCTKNGKHRGFNVFSASLRLQHAVTISTVHIMPFLVLKGMQTVNLFTC